MAHFKHLSLTEKIAIQRMLASRRNLHAIARELKRDYKSIVREVRVNRTFIFNGAIGLVRNNCANRNSCKV